MPRLLWLFCVNEGKAKIIMQISTLSPDMSELLVISEKAIAQILK